MDRHGVNELVDNRHRCGRQVDQQAEIGVATTGHLQGGQTGDRLHGVALPESRKEIGPCGIIGRAPLQKTIGNFRCGRSIEMGLKTQVSLAILLPGNQVAIEGNPGIILIEVPELIRAHPRVIGVCNGGDRGV